MEVINWLGQNWVALLSAVISAVALFYSYQSALAAKLSARAALQANTNALKSSQLAILQEAESFQRAFSGLYGIPTEEKLGQFHRVAVVPAIAYMPQPIAADLADIYDHCKRYQEQLNLRRTPDMRRSGEDFDEPSVRLRYKSICSTLDNTINSMRPILQLSADS
ncbi:hypothetical protein [Chromobacterium haemolyticum]|uniref:hypothetical protein n=1 Tax=Chromobacterium haemolyticum TaxID=394935 RepID=UPI0009DB06ED|nr:hypothetical protein [Chromobacterium haemolyticum]OQS44866.1 hypothetical protein B0T39_01060 [Chromobacterium haemolyticum]